LLIYDTKLGFGVGQQVPFVQKAIGWIFFVKKLATRTDIGYPSSIESEMILESGGNR
jgi:hypothetical protein